MKIIGLFIVISLVFILNSCNDEYQYHEVIPTAHTLQIKGHEFYVKGTLDGNPFEINHISTYENNQPSENSTTFGFITHFVYDDPNTSKERDIILSFGLSRGEEKKFSEIIGVDTTSRGWYGFQMGVVPSGKGFVGQMTYYDESYTSLTGLIADYTPFNEFYITEVELLPKDENLDDRYDGRLYKIKGHFKTLLDNWDNDFDNDTTQLIVDEFSAMFYDDSI